MGRKAGPAPRRPVPAVYGSQRAGRNFDFFSFLFFFKVDHPVKKKNRLDVVDFCSSGVKLILAGEMRCRQGGDLFSPCPARRFQELVDSYRRLPIPLSARHAQTVSVICTVHRSSGLPTDAYSDPSLHVGSVRPNLCSARPAWALSSI